MTRGPHCGRGVAAHPVAILAAVPAFLGGYAMLNADSVLIGFGAVVTHG